jgi:hypothetical protein
MIGQPGSGARRSAVAPVRDDQARQKYDGLENGRRNIKGTGVGNVLG